MRSDSPMASPLVCVAKKQGGVRLACDYRYVNSFTAADVVPVCTVDEMIRKVGRGRYISLFGTVVVLFWKMCECIVFIFVCHRMRVENT